MGVVEDVSERGLCVSLDVEMQPGTAVMLREADGGVRGLVRHCTIDEAGGYHVGFEFEPCVAMGGDAAPSSGMDP